MDNYVLKLSAELITPCLVHIFNLSVSNGKVQSSWKTVRVSLALKEKVVGMILEIIDQFP